MNPYIFYEESGHFKVGVIKQENPSTYLIHTMQGKCCKIKTNNVFLTFNSDPQHFLLTATQLAESIDVALLWSTLGESEFSGEVAAHEYFGASASEIEIAAIFIAIYASPIYFYKKGKNLFKTAPEENLKQALNAMARKKQQEEKMKEWIQSIENNQLPEEIRTDLLTILHQPDKQSLTYKAFAKAAELQKLSFFELAHHLGAVDSIHQYFLDGFTIQHIPNTTAILSVPEMTPLPTAAVKAFSIDDTGTTEIDDAFSLTPLENGNQSIGIHIALPSMWIHPHSEIEHEILQRLSTIYFPTGKITMLPENWIQAFSLNEGTYRPVMSLYIELDSENRIVSKTTKVETVFIQTNLRIEKIEHLFTPENSNQQEFFPHHHALTRLYDFALTQQKQRGKHDANSEKRFDYIVMVDESEHIDIRVRERGAPIDLLVSELMILANSTWAEILHTQQHMGLFRGQTTGKVFMSTHAEPHIGLGVQHYAWFTSPLRRATDYINQKQLLHILDNNQPLRFQEKDRELWSILTQFESTYAIYSDFQRKMETYWSLKYIQQQLLKELTGIIIKEDLVRIEGLPLTVRAHNIPIDILPKTRILLSIREIDLLHTDIHLVYKNVLTS